MLLSTNTEIVFTAREIETARFIGGTKEQAQMVFTAWLDENKDWITAGRDNTAIEILGVDYDLVSFNGQVLVSWLCDQCAEDVCESNGEPHQEIIDNCKFEEIRFISDYRR